MFLLQYTVKALLQTTLLLQLCTGALTSSH